jgi:hypothetical protein
MKSTSKTSVEPAPSVSGILGISKDLGNGKDDSEPVAPVSETATPKTPISLDPFDPEAVRLDVSFNETVGVTRLLTTIPVRQPTKQEFVRVHRDPKYRVTPVGLVELQAERESYLVARGMVSELPGQYALVTLYTAINRQGVLFLWPVKLPGFDGRQMAWHRSKQEAAEKAMDRWVRIQANQSMGAYEIFLAREDLSEPVWPDITMAEIIKIAFRYHLIDKDDHLVVKQLRGEI